MRAESISDKYYWRFIQDERLGLVADIREINAEASYNKTIGKIVKTCDGPDYPVDYEVWIFAKGFGLEVPVQLGAYGTLAQAKERLLVEVVIKRLEE